MRPSILIIGDIVAILIVTVVGFATHGEADIAFLPRMAALFFPLCISWFVLAPALGIFQPQVISHPKHLWRPAVAMIFAAAFAAVLRGLLLNAPIIPIFAVVLSATSAFGILIWRGISYWIARRH